MLQEVPWGRLVGRDAELSRMLTLLDDAASGQAVVALIGGDAGVGKTRLVAEVTRLATEQGFTVLSGHCAELGESVPYLPLADALRGVTQPLGAAPAGAHRAAAGQPPGAARLRDALAARPLLGRLLPESGTAAPAGGDESGMARQQMLGAVLGLLAELAAAAPVLLVLEDLHWADASTRDLLTFLSRVLRTERVAIVGTYRTDDLHRRHPLRPVLAELQRLPTVTAIQLGPLEPAALAEHLTALAEANRPSSGGSGLDAVGPEYSRPGDSGRETPSQPLPYPRSTPSSSTASSAGPRATPTTRKSCSPRRRTMPRRTTGFPPGWSRCCSTGWNGCPMRRSACCGWPRSPGGGPTTS